MQRLALVILVAACGNGGPKHWKDQPTVTLTGTSEGHAFSFEGPQGMQTSSVDSTEFAYHAKVDGEDYVFAPRVNIHFSTAKQTLDDALKLEKEAPIRKATLPDGWAYSMKNPYSKDKDSYVAYAEKDLPDGSLRCNAQVYPMTKSGGEDVSGKLLPLVEKMCASLKAK